MAVKVTLNDVKQPAAVFPKEINIKRLTEMEDTVTQLLCCKVGICQVTTGLKANLCTIFTLSKPRTTGK